MNGDWATAMSARLRALAAAPPDAQTLRPHVEAVVRRAAVGKAGRVSVQASAEQVTVTASGPVAPVVRAELRRSMPDLKQAVKADVQRKVHP